MGVYGQFLLLLNYRKAFIDLEAVTTGSKHLAWTDITVNNELFRHVEFRYDIYQVE